MNALTGARPLLAVTLRQNARSIAPWVAGVAALSASSIVAFDVIFTDAEQRAGLARTLGSNPALALVFGPARDLLTADGFNAWRSGVLGAFIAALMAIVLVVRTSRADEDSGQAELIASGVLSRPARLSVAVATAGLASVAAGVLTFVITVAVGGGIGTSLILAGCFTASGLMFTGVAAVTAQLASEAGAATGLAMAALGVSYLIRGFVDTSGSADWAHWLSPLGWLQQTRPATDNDPWPLLAALGLAAGLTLAAFVLQARRDFGQGVIATRHGRARAGYAGTIWGLAVKLNRGSLVTWLLAFVAIGVVFGDLVSSVEDVIASNPAFEQLAAAGGGSSPTFGFIVTILQLAGLIAAVFGVQVVMRVYGEETSLRAEPLLAGALHRSTYLASSATVAFLGPTIAYLIGGIAIAVVAQTSQTSSFGDVISQTLVTLPAIWVLIALALAAVGAHPAVRVVGWLGVVASFVLTLLGPTFRLPEWALGISPLHHVPNVTAHSPAWTGLIALIAVAAALTIVAFAGYRRRDIAAA